MASTTDNKRRTPTARPLFPALRAAYLYAAPKLKERARAPWTPQLQKRFATDFL